MFFCTIGYYSKNSLFSLSELIVLANPPYLHFDGLKSWGLLLWYFIRTRHSIFWFDARLWKICVFIRPI